MTGEVLRVGPFWWIGQIFKDDDDDFYDYQVCVTRGLAKRWVKQRLEQNNV